MQAFRHGGKPCPDTSPRLNVYSNFENALVFICERSFKLFDPLADALYMYGQT